MKLDEPAVTKIRELLSQETDPDLRLRVFVQGGGCSGFQYGFTFDDHHDEDDWDFDYEGVRVVVDSMSMQYLQGSSISWREDVRGSSFVIENPNATTTCGCGSSFSV
jgi:iron-sulfur cluster insertion protein